MKHVLFILVCMTAFFAACDNNDDGGSKELELAKGTNPEQTLFADENGVKDGIRFTAASDWTATVTEVPVAKSDQAAQTVEWITLSAYSGGAGEHTLTMTVRDNHTGKGRKAEIVIRCGVTEITVTVEQKADKTDGTVAKPVKKIAYRETNNSDAVDGYTNTKGDYDKTFGYDAEGRVARIVTEYKEKEDGTVTHSFDYRIVGEIGVTCHRSGYDATDTYRAKLDARGNVTELQEWESGEFMGVMTFTYSEEGRLLRIEDEEGMSNLFYEDGLLVKDEYKSKESSLEDGTAEFPIATTYPNRIPDNGAIGFWGLYVRDDDYDFLFSIGRLGKISDCMPEVFSGSDEDCAAVPDMGYSKPNQTFHESARFVEWPEDAMMGISYEFDDDKNLVKMVMTDPFTVVESEWDIVVGSELVSPQEPWRGYKYEIKNRTRKKVRDDRNVYTYTITY